MPSTFCSPSADAPAKALDEGCRCTWLMRQQRFWMWAANAQGRQAQGQAMDARGQLSCSLKEVSFRSVKVSVNTCPCQAFS